MLSFARHFLLSVLAFSLGLLVLTSAASASQSAILDSCRQEFDQDPQSYDRARCFYSRSANRRAAGRALLEDAIRAYPDSLYLHLVRAHFMWGSDLAQARRIYQETAERFHSKGHDVGESIARSNLVSIYANSQDLPRLTSQLEEIEKIIRRTTNIEARALGVVAIVKTNSYRLWSIGQRFSQLKEFSDQDLQSLSYTTRRALLRARSNTAILHSEYSLAYKDATALTKLAQQEGDANTVAETRYLLVRIALGRAAKFPSDDSFVQVEQSLDNAVQAARVANNKDLEAISLGALGGFLGRFPTRQTEAWSAIKRCLALVTGSDDLTRVGCLITKSRLLAGRDPQRAWEIAQDTVENRGNSFSGFHRVRTLRNLMIRSWAVLPEDEARRVSLRALTEIEELRNDQQEVASRQQAFSRGADDYVWLANHLLTSKSPATSPRIAEAFEIIERGKARTHLERAAQQAEQDSGPDETSAYNVTAISKVQNALHANEALISFQVGVGIGIDGEDYGKTWATVITKESLQIHPIELTRASLQDLVTTHHGALRSTPQVGLEIAARLNKLLFEPLRASLPEQVDSLIMIPAGPLASVPWAELSSDFAFSSSPSATSWIGLRASAPVVQDMKGLVVFDPEYRSYQSNASNESTTPAKDSYPRSSELDPLIHSQREASTISQLMGTGIKLLGQEQATKGRLLENWRQGFNLLHVSAHSDPDQGPAIILAANGERPYSRLEIDEIESLPMHDALVVLAGCGTASGTWVAGEGVLSLARAFQLAGARTVVSSLWPVDDRMTSKFFVHFYRELSRGQTVGQATQAAQAAMASKGASPRDWAGFVVIGDGRLTFPATRVSTWTAPRLVLALVALLFMGFAFLRRSRPWMK